MRLLLRGCAAVALLVSSSAILAQANQNRTEWLSAYRLVDSSPTTINPNGRAASTVSLYERNTTDHGKYVLRYQLTGPSGQAENYFAGGDSLLVKLKDGVTDPQELASALSADYEPLGIANIFVFRLTRSPTIDSVENAIAVAGNDPMVEYAEPNWYQFASKKRPRRPKPTIAEARRALRATTPNDTNIKDQWYLNNSGQTGGAADSDIDAFEAWDAQTGSRDVVVGVLDTGIDYRHPDLAANLWNNPQETGLDSQGRDRRTNGIDDDSNGYVDDWKGWDFAYGDNDPLDAYGHGTHVAGIISAATNNGRGIAGISWNARLMPLKFLNDEGRGTTDNAIRALAYAMRNGATLTNNSWGGGAYSQALLDSIEAGKRLFVAAAGNDGLNTDVNPHYPSTYESDYVISVAATDHRDQLGRFSNYGATSVDIGAPGVDIYSTWLNGSYGRLDGTSMAAPTVAGAIALLKAQYPAMSPLQLKSRILGKADPVASLGGKVATGARLNIANGLVATYSAEVPIGSIMAFFGRMVDIPDNWMICDGSQVLDPQSPMAGMFVPDLRGRFISGANASQPAGSSGGLATSPSHAHQFGVVTGSVFFDLKSGNGYAPSYNPASRAHAFDRRRVVLGAPAPELASNPYESHGHMNGRAHISGATQPGGSHDNRPPFVAMHYLIRIR